MWWTALAAAAEPAIEAAVRPVEVAEHATSLKVSLLPGLGWQAAGDRSVDGLSIGLMTRSPVVDGVDIAVVSVVTEEMSSVQVGGALATAGHVDGVVIAPITVVRSFDGSTFGLLNLAGDGQGAMFGLVNVARTLDGPAFGLVNVVGDGLFRVDMWASESSVANVGLKVGSKVTYTLVGAGWVRPGGPWWTAGGGFGLHLPARFAWFEVDLSGWMVAEGNAVLPGGHGKLRAQVGLPIARHFQPFAGASLNGWWGNGQVWPVWVGDGPWGRFGERTAAWPGVHAGVSW